MTHRPSRAHVRRFAIGLSVALIAGAVAVPALANDGPKTYTASVAPDGGADAQVCAGLSTTFTLKLTNTSSQQQLGSANITPGFDVKYEGATTNTIELRDLGLAPGEHLDVEFTGSPTSSSTFYIVAKQANNFRGNPGNNLTPSGEQASVTVTDCELSLRFRTQPGDSVVDELISGPPSVETIANGVPVSIPGVNITIAVNRAGLDGTLTRVPDTNGLATFDDLRVREVGNGYFLTASAGDLNLSVNSDPFDVLYDISTCEADTLCETTAEPIEGFTLSASGTATGDGGRLSIGASVAITGLPGCQPPDGVSIGTLPAGSILDGRDLTNKQAIFTIGEQLRKAQTNNGVSFYQLCVEPLGTIPEETRDFVDRYTGKQVIGQVEFDKLSDAGEDTSTFQIRGFLPDCKTGSNGVPAPCVANRSGTDDGGVTITMDFGSRFRQ